MVTPVSSAPSSTALCMGAAPLYLGRRDACTFTAAILGISKISFDIICPNAATTKKSGDSNFIFSIKPLSLLIISGSYTSIPRSEAHLLTAVGILLLRLTASFCVMQNGISTPALWSASKDGTAKSGLPMNTTFIPRRPFLYYLPYR